ncbi:hypothetical protein [Luteimonas sp. R10]|uniref:hypothetical protein n=1 Tax=Luteimonas sp. R10 TaxID=3108176 RepID=UPI0030926683|nr:hypothetical protein U3649_12445 [Luteimonas sp. R10]
MTTRVAGDPNAENPAGIARLSGLHLHDAAMIELNPVRQRIADLQGRLDALRGYL